MNFSEKHGTKFDGGTEYDAPHDIHEVSSGIKQGVSVKEHCILRGQ